MARLVARRLVGAVPLVLLASFSVFVLLRLAPGDPAASVAGQNSTLEQLDRLREQMGLDQPLLVQYGQWLGDAVRGDLGTSLFSSQPVTTSVFDRLPPTLSLTVCATLLSVLVGVPLGIAAATRAGSGRDRAISMFSSIGLAIPSFWLALLLVLVFVSRLGWLPATGYVALTDDPIGWARTMVLPSIALALPAIGVLARQTRSALLDVMHADFMTAARSRGLSVRRTILRHGLKNASIPLVTLLGLQILSLLGGSVIVEQVFAIPGLGSLAISSVSTRDFTMIQGVVVLTAVVVVVVNLLVDIAYAYLNPKARTA